MFVPTMNLLRLFFSPVGHVRVTLCEIGFKKKKEEAFRERRHLHVCDL